MTRPLSPAAERLLAACPVRRAITVRRLAHTAGLCDRDAEHAALELVAAGQLAWAGEDGPPPASRRLPALVARPEGFAMAATMTRLAGPATPDPWGSR